MAWQVFRRLATRTGRRVATFHDTPPPTLSGNVMRRIFRGLSGQLSQRLDAMIAVSASPESHLRRRAGCALYRLPPCVDLAPYLALPLPFIERAQVILFVGRLEPRKGVLTLIQALPALRRDHPQARLVVCGDGPQRPAATDLVRALELADAVDFAGALDEQAKRALYRQADVFCAPSAYGESYGLVLAEAMAAGLPVVAAANPGYRSVLVGEGARGLVTPGDPHLLAQRLSLFFSDEALRLRLSRWGRDAARCAPMCVRACPNFCRSTPADREVRSGLGCGHQRMQHPPQACHRARARGRGPEIVVHGDERRPPPGGEEPHEQGVGRNVLQREIQGFAVGLGHAVSTRPALAQGKVRIEVFRGDIANAAETAGTRRADFLGPGRQHLRPQGALHQQRDVVDGAAAAPPP